MTEPRVVYHLPTPTRTLQFTPETIPDIKRWLTSELSEQGDCWDINEEVPYLEIDTREGQRQCEVGYYVCRDLDGGWYGINPELMPRLYNLDEETGGSGF